MSGLPSPRPAGSITIAGKTVSRMGLGTMGLTGPGTWGAPADRAKAIELLITAVRTLGVTHIDTADAYGPHVAEELVHSALSTYRSDDDLLIATKVGMVRPGPNQWTPLGHPAYLRASVEGSLRRLGTECLDLCYLHRNAPDVPFLEQVGVLADLQKEGKIAHIGLSKVSPAEVDEAATTITVAAVQNKLSMAVPEDATVGVEHCRIRGIPYVAYAPLGSGSIADKPAALRWLLGLGEHVAPIPGTRSVPHLNALVEATRDA